MTGTRLAASSRACACAPWRGGSNTTASKRLSSAAWSGFLNRSRRSAATGFKPDAVAAARLSAASAASSVVDRDDTRRRGKPQRERPDAREQVGDAFGAGARLQDEPRQRRLACHRRLQECGGRQDDGRGAHLQRRRARLRDQLAMARQPRKVLLRGDARQRRGQGRRQRTRAAHVDIEAGIGRRDLDIERLSAWRRAAPAIAQAAASAPSRLLARIGQRSIAIT